MKKLLLALSILLCLSSCGTSEVKYETTKLPIGESDYVNMDFVKMEDSILEQNIIQRGNYFEETYQTKDYLTNSSYYEKKVNVYTPYNYDSTKPYDIIYLMHGHTGDIDALLKWGKFKEMLDILIAAGKIPPIIAVAPSYAPHNLSGYTYSIEQCYDYIKVFHEEFENDLMPYIEGKYHTYSNLSVAKSDLESSRDHRMFGGFSLGSLTTWYQIYNDTNYISTFIPMALDFWSTKAWGGKDVYEARTNANALIRELVRKDVSKDSIQIYAAIGKNDSLFIEVDNYMKYLFARNDYFTSSNLHYGVYNEGIHDFDAARVYFINALLNIYEGYQDAK